MGFWCFMLAMDLIIPLSMIFLGKYFSKRAPKEINMLFGYRTTRSTKKSGHLAICAPFLRKALV